jgi:hypothetical protein
MDTAPHIIEEHFKKQWKAIIKQDCFASEI